jgi:pyruvate/2-oxoglutarate dehydrogenase complex dihydrolipoamide dehydrogenase (E3) component
VADSFDVVVLGAAAAATPVLWRRSPVRTRHPSTMLRTPGFVKPVRRRKGPVVGILMSGSRASELVGEAPLIHGWKASPEDVAPFVHAHT